MVVNVVQQTLTSTPENVVEVKALSHNYGDRAALKNLSFTVGRGEIFALLGPNGGGKTTTFRILSTLIKSSGGSARLLGFDVAAQPQEVRRRIGVVFQSPSLDKKLTAFENLRHQGHLYGLRGAALTSRIKLLLERVKLADRANEYVESFSGGMRRRVELAKGLLHSPQVLLLDEPSTGLDPGARRDLWQYLQQLSRDEGVTSILTTHYMEEAAQCNRIAILNQGELVALDTPDNLRATIGGDIVTIQAREPEVLKAEIQKRLNILEVSVLDNTLRIERLHGHELVGTLAQMFASRIESMTLSKPTLEDVFIRRTGHKFWVERVEPATKGQRGRHA
jgi:ABC-2 type transport system ATP-binding protein